MGLNCRISGFERVKANLHKALAEVQTNSVRAMYEIAQLVRYDMEKTPPLIPVDTGKLRASWFTSVFYTLKGPGMVMGFSANYAAYVHEMVGAKFKREDAGAKFFEAALKRNKDKMLLIIEKDTKL